jgi:hypothetical protein
LISLMKQKEERRNAKEKRKRIMTQNEKR